MYKKRRALMDTYVSLTVVADSKEEANNAMENAFSSIKEFGERISFFSENSELSEINRNAGIRKIVVSAQTFDVIEKALYVSNKSGGAFDPTIGPITRLWDFHAKIKPDPGKIKRKLPLVNYKNVLIDKDNLSVFLKEKGMLLDLGGIAKGYAADLAADSLRKGGIEAGLVAIAGDIVTFGLKPDASPWNIGIKNPRQKNSSDEIAKKIRLTDRAISTSGDYERYFLSNGNRYHHLLDPTTGYPVNNFRSVSIITERGVLTDSFSTAVFVLGPEKGISLVKEMGMDAVFIDNDGTITVTEGLEGTLF
jgi:thiamine biosynthesis lipoprotein